MILVLNCYLIQLFKEIHGLKVQLSQDYEDSVQTEMVKWAQKLRVNHLAVQEHTWKKDKHPIFLQMPEQGSSFLHPPTPPPQVKGWKKEMRIFVFSKSEGTSSTQISNQNGFLTGMIFKASKKHPHSYSILHLKEKRLRLFLSSFLIFLAVWALQRRLDLQLPAEPCSSCPFKKDCCLVQLGFLEKDVLHSLVCILMTRLHQLQQHSNI